MNGPSPNAALAASERILPAAVVALCAILLLWEFWLAPVRQGGSWLVLKAVPLLLALPGIFQRRPYTRQWLSLLLPLYVAEGIVRAWTEPGRTRVLSLAEIGLATMAFAAILALARGRRGPPVKDVG